MKLSFRRLDRDAPAAPEPGTLAILSREAGQARRLDLARLALERGPDAFLAGPGAIRELCIDVEPTFDDMLAAAILAARLDGEPLPPLDAFAEYAALSREGLRVGDVPLEASLDGIFKALRNRGDANLETPATSAAFLSDWERLRKAIWAAASAGKDPFKDAFLASDVAFARARAFLASDRDVYRQDVRRGQRWVVRIPGHDALASALILIKPKSLLAKHWARRDSRAPAGGAYLLLGVRWDPGVWIFTTDPVQRLPIGSLAQALQAKEREVRGAEAEASPWFDGAPFQHSLVAAPRGGTKLSDEQVLGVVRQWCGGRPPRFRRAMPVGATTAGAFALAALAFYSIPRLTTSPQDAPEVLSRSSHWQRDPTVWPKRGAALGAADKAKLRGSALDVPGFALLVCVGESRFGRLPGACSDTAKLYALLVERYGFSRDHVIVLADSAAEALRERTGVDVPIADRPTRVALWDAQERLQKAITRYQEEQRARGNASPLSELVFYYAGHGARVFRSSRPVGYLVLEGYAEHEGANPDQYGYDMGQLARDFDAKIAGTHKLLLIDSCFSGLAIVSRGTPTDAEIYEKWKDAALAVIAASGADEEANEVVGAEKRENKVITASSAIFTGSLVKGLATDADAPAADLNGDHIVTDSELAQYLADEVPAELARHAAKQQRPMYLRGIESDGAGQFLLIPRPSPKQAGGAVP